MITFSTLVTLIKKDRFFLAVFFSIVILITGTNCIRPKNRLFIETNGDTIIQGNDFKAELFVPYKNGFLPAFRIIRDSDTTWLPIDTTKRCAVLKAASKKSGEKVYNGIVDYIDSKGIKRSEKFTIKYYVK